jgi:hypothetical protein
MKSQLERAINLAANTGDKIIVVDEFNDRNSVVMSLDDYEKLLKGQNKGSIGVRNLTEEELLDKINHDIVSWKDANSDRNFSSEIPSFHDSWESPFAKATGDKDEDDENDFEEELDFNEDADDDDNEIVPYFTAPNFDSEGNMIPDTEEDDDESVIVSPSEPKIAKADEDQNLYYYNEPEKTGAEKEENGFTSIKDELKNRKHWEIPEEVKKSAEDIRF